MSKNSHKALASATVMSLVLTSTLAATNVQAAAEVTRMPGADRYTTAQTVAKKSFGKAENVVLVNGLGYADSVSATPFAKLKNAPILLTDAEDKPSADLLATLTELGAKNIYIVGGKGVVTEAMEKELAKNYTVERIGGTSRYETNAEIAKKVIAETKAEKAILVNGQDGYADALSVASVAATKGYPVIFGNKNNVPTVVKDAVKDVKEILAVGGEGVLPDAVIKTVEAKRIAKGADRFDTNLKVLEHFNADFNFDNIFVAAGGDDSTSKFADALVASAAAAKHGAPVVLTGLGANKDNVDKSVKYVKDKMGDNTKVTIVGGTASVSDAIEKDIKGEKESTGKAEVQSIEALNLNQIKVVFDGKVDKDTAEDIRNYEIDGTQFTADDKNDKRAIAVLQDDDRTVILTIADSQSQEKEKEVKVRKGILTEDKSKLVKEKEVKVKFKDVTAPTVKKVEAKGNSKLTIEFSEPVLVTGGSEKEALRDLAREVEINGTIIDSLGYNDDEDLSKLKDYVKVKGENKYYTNKVEFYFDSALDNGTNKLTVPDGEKDEYLMDAAGFAMKEKEIDFKVEEVTSRPKVKSVKGSTDGKIYINFDRAMDIKTVKDGTYYLNGKEIFVEPELKEGDTQIKFSGVKNVLTGSNTIEIDDSVRDAFGNKVEQDLRIAFNADKDEVKPKVNHVLVVDDDTVRIVFSKDVSKDVAERKDNYTFKDSKGTKLDIEVKSVSGTDDMYDIKLNKKKLDGTKYTLKIENIIDLAGNIMDDYTTTINGTDVIPTVNKVMGIVKKIDNAGKVEVVHNKVVVIFDQEMKSSTINKLGNYKYRNDSNEVKSLPSDSKISVASDNKTVTIEFPDSYYIKCDGVNTDGKSNIVDKIIITKDVESASGTKMDADETCSIDEPSTSKVKLVTEPVTLKDERNDLVLSVRFNGAIDKVDKPATFAFIDKAEKKNKGTGISGEVVPTSVVPRGEIVEFRFSGDDADKARAIGVDLEISKQGKITDYAGQKLDELTLSGVNVNEVAPKLLYSKKDGYVKVENEDAVKGWNYNYSEGTITVKFNTKIDEASTHRDDFSFIGTRSGKLDVKNVKEVKANSVTYQLEDNSNKKVKEGEDIIVKVSDNQNIKSKEDINKDRIAYKPESEEKGENLKIKVAGVDTKILGDASSKVDKIANLELEEEPTDANVKEAVEKAIDNNEIEVKVEKVEDGKYKVTLTKGTEKVEKTIIAKKADTVIKTAAIAGVTAPVKDAEPVTTITETDEYTAIISWSPEITDKKFAAKTAYTATITLTPKAGYTLNGVAENFFKVEGATTTNGVNSGVVKAVFAETAE
ncbi:Putative cell wall binding repeat 2 [Clostridium cochlearium]|uniref:Cell wall binding repeat 2 n=1 Tax=Clostridium cochlearium TaxID=1494 RepID=A0ABY0QLE2_CLOCO|nr:cell wall-binding repeat-containing protein [Clostridium cochlearium]SDL15184.1 Putative cell wall binding repeat 2 [Clostridium cochlearium]